MSHANRGPFLAVKGQWSSLRQGYGRQAKVNSRQRPGFTLIELLLAMSIIGGLAAITITAINPSRQFAEARNAQRRSDVKTILEAMQQHMLDQGSLPNGVDGTWRMLGADATGCSLTCGVGGATQVTLSASADSYLYQFSPTTNYGSATQIQEYPWSPSWTKRGIIQFNLSAIPSTATVSAATLRLHESQAYGVGTQTVALHRMTRSWTENGASWNRHDGTNSWTTPGGDFHATATATVSISWTGATKWDTWNVQSEVQNFVSGSLSHFGWLIKDNIENASQAYWYFDSREAGSSTNRPQLVLDYSVAGVAGGVTEDACLNANAALQGTYIPTIPADPLEGSPARTTYALRVGSDGRLSVRACGAELGEDIVVTR